MKRAVLYFLMISVTVTASCSSVKAKPGMTQAQVEAEMGEPIDRAFTSGKEEWIYEQDGKRRVVVFEHERVSAVLDDAAAAKRELVAILPSYACVHSNAFGDYANGGGCNAFGCWPPGGSCSPFGCSEQGECSAESCPHRITSYQCMRAR